MVWANLLPIMKLKWRIGIGLAVTAATYCVLAYIFMWPPVVRNYWRNYRLYHTTVKNGIISEAIYGNYCDINLRQINRAIDDYAISMNKHTGDPITFSDLTSYIKPVPEDEMPKSYNQQFDSHTLGEKLPYVPALQGQMPVCPCGGTYEVTRIGELPTCSLATNKPYKVRVNYFYWKWTNLPAKLDYGHSLNPIQIDWHELP